MAYNAVENGALCGICPLAKNGQPNNNPCPAEPNKYRLKLVVVGEAPGTLEENLGRPFVGRTGKLFEKLLTEESKLSRENCYLTNAALCRGDTDDENKLAAECCAPRLLRELAALPAEIPVLTLGSAATKTVLGVASILVGRGFIFETTAPNADSIKTAARNLKKDPADPAKIRRAALLEGRQQVGSRKVIPTLHPAFVLRADPWMPVLKADMRRVGRLVRGEIDISKTLDKGSFEVVDNVAALWKLGPDISLDLETDGLKTTECNIRTAQFSDGERTLILFPWRPEFGADLTDFLKSRRSIVGHNTRTFDEVVLHYHGVDVRGLEIDDSLIGYHSYASHLRMGMDHVASLYLDLGPWKLEAGKRGGAEEKGGAVVESMTAEELFDYGAADARIEAHMWPLMRRDLDSERKVYDHDMKLAAICRDMQIEGIGFDQQRANELSSALLVEAEGLKEDMRKLVGQPTFEPTKLDDVKGALFDTLRAPKLHKTPKGDLSTASLTLEALSTLDTAAGEFARALLRWRVVTKIRSTYVERVHVNPKTGRVHYSWKPFGTVSGRLSCRLQSAARYDATDNAARVRELYIPKKGNVFVYYDVSQAEMRLAAFLSADPVFMAACSGDVHANNAKVCFRSIADRGWLDGDAKKDPKRGKPFRDLAKNVGFAISYLAETDKVFATIKAKPEGKDVTYQVVDNMLAALRRAYSRYFAWVHDNSRECHRVGHMRSPFLGRIRWLGYWPKITEVANFPIQSGLADVVNERTIELAPESRRLGAPLVVQGHDACGYDCPEENADELSEIITDCWARPLSTKGGDLVLPIDLKRGERWSELG